jgi:hypothetical protein
LQSIGFLRLAPSCGILDRAFSQTLRCAKDSAKGGNPGPLVLTKLAFEGAMFVRVGAGECAIILVLVLILVIGIAISIRMRGD